MVSTVVEDTVGVIGVLQQQGKIGIDIFLSVVVVVVVSVLTIDGTRGNGRSRLSLVFSFF